MAIGAAVLALPAGILLACCAWRFPGVVRKGLFVWAEFIRGIPLIFVIFWMWYLLPMLTGSDLARGGDRHAGASLVYRRLGNALRVCGLKRAAWRSV